MTTILPCKEATATALCWSPPQAQHIQTMKLIWRPLDMMLLLLLLAAMAFTVLRGLVRWDVRCTRRSSSNLI